MEAKLFKKLEITRSESVDGYYKESDEDVLNYIDVLGYQYLKEDSQKRGLLAVATNNVDKEKAETFFKEQEEFEELKELIHDNISLNVSNRQTIRDKYSDGKIHNVWAWIAPILVFISGFLVTINHGNATLAGVLYVLSIFILITHIVIRTIRNKKLIQKIIKDEMVINDNSEIISEQKDRMITILENRKNLLK